MDVLQQALAELQARRDATNQQLVDIDVAIRGIETVIERHTVNILVEVDPRLPKDQLTQAIDNAVRRLEAEADAEEEQHCVGQCERPMDCHGCLLGEQPAPATPPLRSHDVPAQRRSTANNTGLTAARDAAVLKFLRTNGGVGTSKQLRAVMPKEPGLTAQQEDANYRNTMTRLRMQGYVARTGDTWSLTGAGSREE